MGTDDFLTTALGTHRAISIFSGKNFGTPDQKIELLYGEQYLPVYDPAAKSYTIAEDAMHQNKMPNPVPKYGPSGIGNFFNTYTWTMGVGFKKTPAFASLLVGTFDWSYVLEQMLVTLASQQGGTNPAVPGITLDPEMLEEFMDHLRPNWVSVQTCLWPGVLISPLLLSQMMEWGITLTMVFAPCFPLNSAHCSPMVLLLRCATELCYNTTTQHLCVPNHNSGYFLPRDG